MGTKRNGKTEEERFWRNQSDLQRPKPPSDLGKALKLLVFHLIRNAQ